VTGLLRDLAARGATGRVRLSGHDGDTLVWLRAGRIRLATTPGGLDLAARLRSAGVAAPAAPAGWADLAGLGGLDSGGPGVLEQTAREQTLDALSAALAAGAATHEFSEGEDPGHDLGADLTVDELLESSARRHKELDRMCGRIPGPGAVPRLAGRPGQPADADRAAWALLAMVDGRRSLLDLAGAAGLTPFEVATVLDHLAGAGVLDIDPGGGPPWSTRASSELAHGGEPARVAGPGDSEEPGEALPADLELGSGDGPGAGPEPPSESQAIATRAPDSDPEHRPLGEPEPTPAPGPETIAAQAPDSGSEPGTVPGPGVARPSRDLRATPVDEAVAGLPPGDTVADAWHTLREVTGATDLGAATVQETSPDKEPGELPDEEPRAAEPDLVGRSDVDPGSLLRELASLSMGDNEAPAEERAEPRQAPTPEPTAEPTAEPTQEPERDGRQRSGGRFGFRRGQRQ
jgi:hypothetical protein